MKPFPQVLADGTTVYGVFAKTSDPLFIQAIGRAGFDFVILDTEHGPNSVRDTYPLVMTAYASGLYPVVRVGKLADIDIQRALDLGIAGVQIPQIQCRQDAENAREFSKFHPQGRRGVCRYVPAADLGLMDKADYFRRANDETALIVHIEGMEGIARFDDIVQVSDIDVIFIGPYDLSQSLGLPGQVDHPKVAAEIERLAARCREAGAQVGIFADTVEAAYRYRALGATYIAISVDVGIFAEACRDMVGRLHSE